LGAAYSPGDTFISMLSEAYLPLLERFNSQNSELNEFLQKDARGYQKLHIGTTYLLFRKSDNKLLAYTTLSMGALKLPEKKEEFIFAGKKLSDYPKDFPNQLPALLIGKLATDKSEERRNAATILLKYAIQLAMEQRRTIGCAFLVAHVYTKPEIIKWYEGKFFKRIIQDLEGRETIPMYFELGL
jgi:hypothetical protein